MLVLCCDNVCGQEPYRSVGLVWSRKGNGHIGISVIVHSAYAIRICKSRPI